MFNLDYIFKPKSVAIVGASAQIGSVGHELVKNILATFSGATYLINLKTPKIEGHKSYPNLKSVNKKIDLAIIAVPAPIVPIILTEAGALGIKGAIIISAGFKEMGNIELEEEIRKIALKYKITLIGPNCLGVMNPSFGLNATFSPIMAPKGSVAFISQSGALCTGVLDLAEKLGIGFSKFMSIGNKAVVDEALVLDYLLKDKQTKIIALYVEQLSNAKKLLPLIKKISSGKSAKPVLILKAGTTSAGALASASHTGALAGNDAAYDALFNQSGAIRVSNIEEMFEYLKIFDDNKITAADNLAVITNAGGLGVLAVDAISNCNLKLAKLSEITIKNLKKYLPVAANCNNPIDVLGDAKADRYKIALEHVLRDKAVFASLVILTPQSMTEMVATAQEIVKAKNKSKKAMAVVFLGDKLVSEAVSIFKKNNIANYLYPESAVKSLSKLNQFYKTSQEKKSPLLKLSGINKKAVEKIFSQAQSSGINIFPESSALKILQAYGLPVISHVLVHSSIEAQRAAKKIGKKVVLKIISPDILHKSDAGGVELNVLPQVAGKKYTELMTRIIQKNPRAKIEGVLIEEMIENSGVEMIIGSSKDKSLGNTIMLGLGGIYVEVLKDVAFGINPLSQSDVLNMISQLKSKKILDGVRGSQAVDKKALVNCVLRLAQLLQDFPNISELDINPLLVLENGKGAKVLDARIILEPNLKL